jgi:carboxyl-terminal processing protease
MTAPSPSLRSVFPGWLVPKRVGPALAAVPSRLSRPSLIGAAAAAIDVHPFARLSHGALSRLPRDGAAASSGPTRNIWARLALLAFVAAALFLTGCATTPAPRIALDQVPVSQRVRAEENVRLFNKVWSMVADLHYDPKLQGVDWLMAGAKYGAEAAMAPDDRTLYGSLNQMVGLLKDSHTHVLSPVQATERHRQMRARTGMYMTRFNGRWAVSELTPGSPAETAGVKIGWLAMTRNGETIGDRMDFRPAEGEVSHWEFLDDRDQLVALDLTARSLSTKPQQIMRELPGGIIYLRFDAFDITDRRWLSRQLKEHHDAPGVVIDLRRNPGGGVISMGVTVGEFFDHKVECGTFVTRGGYRQSQGSWQLFSARYLGKVAILIDGSTASAAEIFSAVMQEHGRATIIGRKTAGAVLASLFHGLPGGGELQLSWFDYVTPKGRRLESNGVTPDITVSTSLENLRAHRDADLEEALKVLTTK